MQELTELSVAVNENIVVSAIATAPKHVSACLVFAHGAGAGMHHPFMNAVCAGLVTRGVATLRFQFPYMQKGLRRPDAPPVAHETVRKAVAAARELFPAVPLYAGGKSYGGRMTSQSQALTPLPNVSGLCFFGFPLHPAKKPSVSRAEHLSSIAVPMLFLQGTRDALADRMLIQDVVAHLAAPARLSLIEHADHSFHVSTRSGVTGAEVMEQMLNEAAEWMATIGSVNP